MKAQILTFCVCLVLAVSTVSGQEESEPSPDDEDSSGQEALDVDLIEEAGVDLVLLDVYVTDKEGQPVPGLTADRFKLFLGPSEVSIYSVDDLCECDGAVSRSTVAEPATGKTDLQTPTSSPADQETSPAAAPFSRRLDLHSYVLYFDFSQLQIGGRGRAIDAARRWLLESRTPDDEVMIIGFSSTAGLREVCGFTKDSEELMGCLDRAMEDKELVDTFPNRFLFRIGECVDCIEFCQAQERCPGMPCYECCPECTANPMQEFAHGRRAFRALTLFMQRLEHVPGRKSVLYFHENSTLFPGRFYPIPRGEQDFIGNQLRSLETTAAEATRARARLYSVQTATFESINAEDAATVGFNLADFTGGDYNRNPSDVMNVMRTAGRGCPCIYRLGFEPRNKKKSNIYRARVEVNGHNLPFRYRVQVVNPDDRLMRRAQYVMSDPSTFADIVVSANLIPVTSNGRSWDVTVQVAVEIDSLALLPLGEGGETDLDIGALLYREDGKNWEMLTRSTIRKPSRTAMTGPVLCHERALKGLKAGNYRLVAFARNTSLDVYGGGESDVVLPRARSGGMVGPILMQPDRMIFQASLPAFKKGHAIEDLELTSHRGSVPSPSQVQVRGRPVEMVTWLCPENDAWRGVEVLGFISQDGVPRVRLPAVRVDPAGQCARLTSRINTDGLIPGLYDYQFLWARAAGEESFSPAVPIRIVPPLPMEPTAKEIVGESPTP